MKNKLDIFKKNGIKLAFILGSLIISMVFTSCNQNNKSYNTDNPSRVQSGFTDRKLNSDERAIAGVNSENLYVDDKNNLIFTTKDKSLIVCELQYDEFFMPPTSALISKNEFLEKSIIYYSFPGSGWPNFYFYMVQYNKEKESLDIIWTDKEMDILYDFNDYKINIYISNNNQIVVSEDISNIFNDLENEIVDELINSGIKNSSASASNAGINDYNGNGNNEFFLKYDINYTERNLYLTSVYVIMGTKEDDLVVYNAFTSEYNNDIVEKLLENGYIMTDEIEDKDIKKLIDKGIVKQQKDKFVINLEVHND